MKFHVFPLTEESKPRRALLIFAGWGMDWRPFASLKRGGYSVIAVWDYRDPALPEALVAELHGYEEIAVIGWSFGVPAASRFLAANTGLPVSARIAVNGTMHPVDDLRGIPVATFQGTLEGLSERTLSKFHLRMCGSQAACKEFAQNKPERGIEELRDELEAVRQAGDAAAQWDVAIVGHNDRIIPSGNQLRAWQGGEAFETIETDSPHLPDFQAIINAHITEKGLVAEKFNRAEDTYDENAIVQRKIAARLCASARDSVKGQDLGILEIGCGTGLTTRMLADAFPEAKITAWDLHIPSGFPQDIKTLECDAETEIRRLAEASTDMIFSASTVQWFNSLPEFLRQVSRVLRSGGRAFISTFGPGTMDEIRSLLPQAAHYPDAEALRRMIPGGLQLTAFEDECHRLHFSSPVEAMRHVKLTGVNALGTDSPGRQALEVIRKYPTGPDGIATITYKPIYISLRKL